MAVVYYAPSPRDYNEASKELWRLLNAYPGHRFLVGRCADMDGSKLGARNEYEKAIAIYGVWAGSKGKCAVLEAEFIAGAKLNLPDLCMNQQVGGGPQSAEDLHLVYVVFW